MSRLVVIGGGAAGFYCAVNAAAMNRGLEVILLEKTSKLLSKVKVSGGGRCNVTHACFSIAEMVKKYPRGGNFLKRIFHSHFTTDTIQWFKERGVELKVEKDGRMFPVTDSSQSVIDCLLREVNKLGVQVRMHAEVTDILHNGRFQLTLKDTTILEADFLCIACGGYPKASMFEWLTRLGHTIEAPVPSLFTFNMPANPIRELMGVVVENVHVKIQKTKLQESGPLLVTHWGMSGPAILKLSAWGARELAAANYHFTLQVNWLPDYNENTMGAKLREIRFSLASQKVINRNPFHLPQRLWEYLLGLIPVKTDLRWADLPGAEQNKLARLLCAQEFEVKGKTTFKEEFVTAGGIHLSEIDPATMMSRKIPRLYFAGEIIDVDGITGGFNFQNAWTTAWIAAKSIAQEA